LSQNSLVILFSYLGHNAHLPFEPILFARFRSVSKIDISDIRAALGRIIFGRFFTAAFFSTLSFTKDMTDILKYMRRLKVFDVGLS